MVSEFELKKVPISSIKFDKTNPNQMSDEQMSSLKLAMSKFGYLSPVILNKDFTVIDGEHRVRVYQELDKKEIPAYVLDIDKLDGKLLRQVMNKIHGEHIIEKDVSELEILFKHNPEELKEFLLFQERDLRDMQELVKSPDQSAWDNVFDQEDNKLEEDKEQITFILLIKDKNKLLENLKTIHKDKDIALVKMMTQWKKNLS